MTYTKKTLLEHMQISDVEIMRRKELLELSDKSLDLLGRHKLLIEKNINKIIDEFYQKQLKTEEISSLLGDSDTLKQFRLAQHQYVTNLFSSNYANDYVNSRLRIGAAVYKKIVVSPILFLSTICSLKDILFKTIKNIIDNKKELEELLGTLDKLLYFDMSFIFDKYIDSLVMEVKNEKRKIEIQASNLQKKMEIRTKQLEKEANFDYLTKIYNKKYMYETLKREIEMSNRRKTKLSLIYFDIDNFKNINDTRGHLEGDKVLRNIGKILIKSVRKTDVSCRFGGDEFCLILPDCNIHKAKEVCEKIIKELKKMYKNIFVSFGLSEKNSKINIDASQLIMIADKKMYLAKNDEGFQIRY